MGTTSRVQEADAYLAARTGCYEFRKVRYDAVVEAMRSHGRKGYAHPTLVDVGAGMTELARCLYADHGWQGRYMPVDAALDGCDLDDWVPPRRADWFVCLEVIEHLRDPIGLLLRLGLFADRGVIVSTPNPETTDVLGMDATHVTPVERDTLEGAGFTVEARSFYGQADDSLFAVWLA